MEIAGVSEPFVIKTRSIGLGLSALRSIADGNFFLPEGSRLAVPDNLIRLAEHVRNGSSEHAKFLERVILNFQPSFARRDEYYRRDRLALADRFASALLGMHSSESVEVVGEVDEDVLTHLGDSFPTYVISLSPPSHFIRIYLAKLYTWSLRERGLIVERGRAVLNKVSHLITTIQFPDRLASFFQVKDQLSKRMFASVGGRTAKYFACIAVAGLGLKYLPVGVAGLAIAVVDP